MAADESLQVDPPADAGARGEAMMREALTPLRAAGATAHHNYTEVMAANLRMWS